MRRLSSMLWVMAAVLCGGCAGPLLRSASLETVSEDSAAADTQYVADLARPYGMNYVQVEAVSLVTGLQDTGGDPPQTPQRATLLAEIRRREIANPAQLLGSPDTALVLVRGLLRPGIKKGDTFDIEVRVPSRSDATSLRGGWLLSSRLTELAVLNQRIHSGHLMAYGEGPILVDPAADKDDAATLTTGRVLGGGVCMRGRSLGLVIDHEHQSIHTAKLIGAAINRRFHTFEEGARRGVANPKNDEFVELFVHPKYKDNISRYMLVLRNIPTRQTPQERQAHLELLANQLKDPLTSATAAIRLEAIGGDDSRIALREVLESAEAEIRFYAAEALAYLDDSTGAATLAETARNEPAFRLAALAALGAMDDPLARNALQSLLAVKSAETRYGAFRALWSIDPNDPLVHGEAMDGLFTLHVVPTTGQPMIHATRSFRPEILLFGADHPMNGPFLIEAGREIMINGSADGTVTVAQFAEGAPTQKRVVTNQVDAVVRAIVELGGTYPDVVQALQEANEAGALASRFRVNALPEPGRKYSRTRATESLASRAP